MWFSLHRALRAAIVAHSSGANAPEGRKRTPTHPDFLAWCERQAPDDIPDPAAGGDGALRCLIVELGHAARAGWAPTLRWISLLLAVATAMALGMAVWK